MPFFEKNILVLLCIFLNCTSIAQQIKNENLPNKYRAVHWGVDEGLGEKRWHNAIIKDVNSFLWFGSSHGELSRFDGSTFKRYYPDKNKPGTIRNDYCLAIVEDSLHNLWIGTFRGLSRYDIKADTFTNFSPHINSSTSNESVIPFWATRSEVFCIETGDQITSYDVHSFKRKKLLDIKQSYKVSGVIPKESYTIFDAQSNSVWMLPEGEEGLMQFSISSGQRTFHKRIAYSDKPDSWGRMDAEAMCFDRKRNCIWMNSHDGLIQFTLNDQQFHHIDALNQLIGLKDYHRMVGIDIDLQGRIWLATMPKGILIYDPSTRFVTKLFSDSAMQHEVADGNLKIYCDRDGIVWTSFFTLNEIYQLIPFSPLVRMFTANPHKPDSLSSLDIHNMIQGEHGQLWIGTTDGLNIFNPQTGTFSVLREKDLPGIKGNAIVPMVIDTLRKKAWLNAGPPDRVYEMNLQTKKCTTVVFKDTAGKIITPVNIIGNISFPYKKACLFFDFGYGIFEIDADSDIARLIIPLKQEIYKSTLVEDSILFLKTFPKELTYYNYCGKWIKKTNPLDSIGWEDIFYDALNKTYWVAASGHMIHYDKDFHIIGRYDDVDELMKGILTILPDNKGNIWFNNDRKAIGNLNIKTGIITTLSEQDGYQKQWYDFYTPAAKEAGGNLYFVGNSLAPGISLDKISPDKLRTYPPATVYFRSLEIKDVSLTLPTRIDKVEKLSLKYFQNRINIETGVIDYYSKGKNHIRYKLEADGKIADWQYTPAKSTIRYEELLPGKYNLVIQASNAANEWNGTQKNLSINISPAFWNTWWFRSLIALCALTILYSFMRYRWQQKFRLQTERAEKEKILAEMRYKTTELEMQALRAQMNPHFIFNSLNAINHFILKNESETAANYLIKFSRLIRMVLNNSSKSFIPLEEELESLQLYIDLERLRFKNSFDYKNSYSDEIDTGNICIPPLILQPFVENAIWHGLMHKESKGKLDINITLEDELLCCIITDDGIGRANAGIIKDSSSEKTKSMGLNITKSRINLINEKIDEQEYFLIHDLVDDMGKPGGTEVIIKIKYRQLSEVYN